MTKVPEDIWAAWKWQSWVESANEPEIGFPLQHLPFCAFLAGSGEPHLGVGIGEHIFDLHDCARSGLLDTLPDNIKAACLQPTLNALMELGREASAGLRATLMSMLRREAEPSSITKTASLLRSMSGAVFHAPARIGNYTDFYASIHHATNVGRLFRPDQPLLPNYKHIPIGYHGRASSIVVSGTPVTRPSGQILKQPEKVPAFSPSQQLDYELEVAAYIGHGNSLGQPIGIAAADAHIFGISLLNDWSARDIQAWEYQPLGPFLGKNFATSVSPWVTSWDALEPFRAALSPRPPEDPEPLPYLRSADADTESIDLQLEVWLSSAAMRGRSLIPVRLSSANFRDLYWTFAQMVTHHTSNGCNLLPGDLLASGTVSGPTEEGKGSLLEITQRGAAPLSLPTGEVRTFLEDGDEVILRGVCRREGFPSIRLGECRGIVLPSRT